MRPTRRNGALSSWRMGRIQEPQPARARIESGRPSAAGMVAPRLFLHPLEPRVVVGELVQVSKRDLRGDRRVVVGDVGSRVVGPVLELDVHSDAKFLDVEGRRVPVYAD